jgi:mannose-1-phosphate guanylyltransferase / mannose-6-phosphate isomerase
MKLIAAIICGGSGSRLWPISRGLRPKPFMKLDGQASLLQQTFKRIQSIPDVNDVLIVTASDLLTSVLEEIQEAGGRQLKTTFILEPSARGTAAAVASAALHCREAYGENSVLLVLPADHVVKDVPAFDKAVEVAISAAANGRLVTFGINPTSAHTGYGYIEVTTTDADTRPHASWLGVRRFVEKPSKEIAEEYVTSGNYLWNSGMFCFSAKVLLQEMRQCCPEILIACENAMGKSARNRVSQTLCVELDAEGFANVPKDTIDIAVMEKSSNIVVVPGQFGWSDIGSWSAIAELATKDENGNSGTQHSILLKSSNCYVNGHGRDIALVGIDDVIVVDTPDALLIVHKDKSEDVRYLKSQDLTAANLIDDFNISRIEIQVGQRISKRDSNWPVATWIVASGNAGVIGLGNRVSRMAKGEAYRCDAHDDEIENIGDIKLVLISVG